MLDVWVPKLGWQSVQPVVPKDAPITATTAGITGSDNDIQALAKIYRTYGSAVEAAAIFHTVEPSLIMAIIYKESLGRVDAVSSSGAVGLMQLVAGTARDAGLNVPEYNRITITLSSGREINVPEHCRSIDVTGCDKVNDERFDPTKNILAGARSLRVFFDSKTRGGSWEKAIKRYRGSTDDIQQAYYNKVVQYQAIAEQIIRQGGSAVSPVSTDALCFPLTQESLNTNKGRNGDNDDWGNSRSEGDRCHAGNDLFEQGPGEVIAITDGTVVAIQKGWTRCEDGWGGTAGTPKGVSAVLVYHPSLGKTINYGEIDDDKVEVNVGGQISKGQFLGVVSYCDTFHLEVYNGEQRTTIKWEPPKGQTVSGGNTKDYCEQNYFNTKPAALEDPQVLLRQIKGNFCEKDTGKFLVQAPIVPTPEATLASIPTGASASSCSNDENFVDPSKSTRANLYKDKWVKALGDAGVHGTTFVSKLQSNGPEDQNLLNEKGRLTLVFAPCSTDFNKPIEMVYYFHGNNGFSYQDGSGAYDDFNKRLAPQIKKMMDAGRNFVIVFPELPWSAGDNPGVSKKNHGKVWADGDSNLVALHNDVLRLLNLRFSNVVVGYISMTGHSGGGSPLKRGVEVGAIQELNVNKITFSDADYGWQGSGSSSLYVYNNYVKDHPNVELNLLVQAPANIGVHEPTKYSVDFVKQIGGSTVSDWSTPGSCENSRCKDLIKTPGVGSSNDGSYVFFVPGHENIAYVPLTLGHTTIGTISLAWQRPSPSTTVASN
ncbi:hypothetical protein COV20_02285 [Candidatus Woesearchaeota archaeon CG10_big_fil_rev_8_21_14_0_10_45_16]|nr:MAG: hypothetical protein COV20_02285 [Candidatus Woesearchaeota archaeon CG10_big_fil_rev_8_21_14_0_10_45_16]